MKRIFLSLDIKCMSPEKLEKRIFGGAELFFLLWEKHLLNEGYKVERWPTDPAGEYDLCIHSNEFNHNVNAKKHIIWAGSWTAIGAEHADVAIVLTNYMKGKMSEEWQDALVIPAPYNSEIYKYSGESPISGKIVCTSNPNRHYLNTISLSHFLRDKNANYSIHLCGGNKLYSVRFPESHDFHMPGLNIIYYGPLPRHQMFELLATAHIYAYPAFDDHAETQSVAPIEAMALGIPTFLPYREPFIEVAKEIDPQPFFYNTLEEFCEDVCDFLKNAILTRKEYDVSRYSEEVIMATLLQLIRKVI
jgi:hypothetical protein